MQNDFTTSTSESKRAITVRPGYASALNEVIEPDKILVLTRYFVRRWMPLLGDNGTRIVIALRSLGYFNRQTGETRDGVEIDLPELAALCGVSVPTIKREFGEKHGKDRKPIPGSQQNPTLHLFVKKDRQYWRDPVTNRLLRTANIYRVLMDDPLHPDDLPRLQEVLDAREKNAPPSKAHIEPKPPKNRMPSKAHFHSKDDESESKKTHIESKNDESESQVDESEPALKDDSSGLQLLLGTSLTPAAAPEFSHSLFGEKIEEPERIEEPKPTRLDWEVLTPEQQQPCRDQAKRELLPYALQAGEKAWARMGPRQEEVRARNIYEASLKADLPEGRVS